MKLSLKMNKILCFILIVFGIILDHRTKQIIINNMELYQSIPLWKGVFHFTYVRNTGAAFSMLSGQRWIFITISSITILAILVYIVFTKKARPVWLYSLAMIASGGIGNMIERVKLGYVTDFFDFTLIDFAIFNVADCFVCVGAFLLLLDLVVDFIKDPTGEKSKKEAEDEKQDEASE